MKFNDYFPNAVLINLDRRADRLEGFNERIKDLDISYKRFSAVEMKDPVAGCKESHLGVITHYDYDPLFIFEDDALFVDDFENKLNTAMAHLPDDWDMLYLGAHILKAEEHNDYWLKSYGCSSTHAYAIRGRIKDKVINALKSHDGHSDRAISEIHPEINAYIVKSTLIWQTPGYSDIQQCEVNYDHLYKF